MPAARYALVPAPWPMQWDTTWPIPAPEVIAGALAAPLKGLWVDHIPTRAEIAALNLGLRRDARIAWTNPLVTGDGKSFDRPWAAGHPERMSPQRVMPDAWFDHGEARCAPPERKGRVVGSRCIVRSLAHRQGVGAPACNRSQPAGAIGATFALTQAPINPNKFRIRSTPPPGPALVRPCRSIRTIRMSRHGRRAGKTTSPGLLRYAPCSRTSSS